jgi:acetyl-CoA C-acetyltransferase
MPEAVIVATARSPIGRAFKGSLVSLRPDDMAAQMIKAVLAQVPELQPAMIEDLLLGNAQPAGEAGYNMARVVALLAGLPSVPGTTVNRYCSSSLQTIRMAAHAVRAGEGDVFIAAGVEAVSRFGQGMADGSPDTHNAQFREAEERSATRAIGGGEVWTPPAGLSDIYIAMGQTAENVRELERVSREDMDRFAARSQQLAVASQENGFFEREISPLVLADGTEVRTDDGPRPGTTVEILAELKPAFRPDGEVTAGNSCPLNDGAAAVVVMSDRRARDLGITPLARVVSSGVTALDPEIMGLGPIEACRQALRRANMTIDDVDLVEINEAFAAQVVPSARHLGIDPDKLNTHGGAIALGHPFGMTGARIMTTLLNGLQTEDKTIGLEAMCVGGGQGMAMVIERLS